MGSWAFLEHTKVFRFGGVTHTYTRPCFPLRDVGGVLLLSVTRYVMVAVVKLSDVLLLFVEKDGWCA